VISVRVDDKIYRVLRYKAQKNGLSLSKYVWRKLVESLVREYRQSQVGKIEPGGE
jgi:predicted HicB family RNase H-like nuclease